MLSSDANERQDSGREPPRGTVAVPRRCPLVDVRPPAEHCAACFLLSPALDAQADTWTAPQNPGSQDRQTGHHEHAGSPGRESPCLSKRCATSGSNAPPRTDCAGDRRTAVADRSRQQLDAPRDLRVAGNPDTQAPQPQRRGEPQNFSAPTTGKTGAVNSACAAQQINVAFLRPRSSSADCAESARSWEHPCDGTSSSADRRCSGAGRPCRTPAPLTGSNCAVLSYNH